MHLSYLLFLRKTSHFYIRPVGFGERVTSSAFIQPKAVESLLFT